MFIRREAPIYGETVLHSGQVVSDRPTVQDFSGPTFWPVLDRGEASKTRFPKNATKIAAQGGDSLSKLAIFPASRSGGSSARRFRRLRSRDLGADWTPKTDPNRTAGGRAEEIRPTRARLGGPGAVSGTPNRQISVEKQPSKGCQIEPAESRIRDRVSGSARIAGGLAGHPRSRDLGGDGRSETARNRVAAEVIGASRRYRPSPL